MTKRRDKPKPTRDSDRGETRTSSTEPPNRESAAAPDRLVRRHMRFGWWALLAFATLGLVLESLHGFKVSFYLDVTNETRRLMWTLAHAHGVFLALLNVAFGATLFVGIGLSGRSRRIASPLLIGASLLLPLGFLMGGVVPFGGDPSPAIVAVPLGGVLLLSALALTAWGQDYDR
jgi:hypothetical protein